AIERGTVLRAQELGLITSLGQWQVLVHRRPRVALLSTGDEVIEPGTPRKAGQIYDANRFTLRGSIEQCGGEVIDLGIVADVRDELRARLLEGAGVGDIVVTSGGVSVGVLDLVKDVLDEIGAIDFWQVAMQPGRPLAFGRVGSAHFFGLPGNPVASMLAFMLFVRPAIYKLAGRRRLFPDTAEATATEAMSKKKGRREFKRGIVQWKDGRWEARTTGPQGSGILSSMAAGNCLIVLEEDRGDVSGFALGTRVLAGDRMIAPGYVGQTLGTADLDDLDRIVREALERAYRRAMVNGEMKADAREKFGPLGESLADTRLHPIEVRQDTVGALYRVDPRTMVLADMVRYATDVSRQIAAVDAGVKYNYVGTMTELARELFVSSEGARIDQSFALTLGSCTVVTVDGEVSQDLYDALGHQRGWEILLDGVDEPALRFPTFVDFALALAREGVALAAAPVLPTSDREVVVVTDPHYNTLVSHEIIGHPVELDRALKMETAYAGRSWLLGGLTEHQVGRRV